MASTYKHIFTDRAESDLDAILTYISKELCNPKAALDFYLELQTQIGNVCNFPLSGAVADNEYVRDKDTRKIIIGNYVLFYKPDAESQTIYILRIVYGKQNLDEIVRTI